MDTLTNNEDPDKMSHNGEFHQGSHCLLRLERFADKKNNIIQLLTSMR